jgi:hypothetical protein
VKAARRRLGEVAEEEARAGRPPPAEAEVEPRAARSPPAAEAEAGAEAAEGVVRRGRSEARRKRDRSADTAPRRASSAGPAQRRTTARRLQSKRGSSSHLPPSLEARQPRVASSKRGAMEILRRTRRPLPEFFGSAAVFGRPEMGAQCGVHSSTVNGRTRYGEQHGGSPSSCDAEPRPPYPSDRTRGTTSSRDAKLRRRFATGLPAS